VRFFSSVRLALWVILLLAIVSLAGALILQVPATIAADPASKATWIQQIAHAKYGGFTEIFKLLGLFDVFHSPLFIILGSLLVINIAVCSLKRWPMLVKTSKGVALENAARLLEKETGTHGNSSDPPSETVSAAAEFFSKHHYRVRQDSNPNATVMVADKNRFAPWFTYAIHLSLILLVVGYLLGSFKGFTNDAFIVVENQTVPVGSGYDVSVNLDSFVDVYWPSGAPEDYQSQVTLLVNGQVVKEGLIRVNHPMNYNGLKIYQSSFGPAVSLLIMGPDGKEIFNGSIPLPYPDNEQGVVRPTGLLSLPDQDMYVFVDGAAAGNDPLVPANGVLLEFYKASTQTLISASPATVGHAVQVQGLTVTPVSLEKFSVFQLRQDPGLNLIWVAFTLFMLGLVGVLYFPNRQILVAIRPAIKGSHCDYAYLGKKNLAAEEMQAFTDAIGIAGQPSIKKTERNPKR
jgi:cytochrome c biogenesis protein